MVPSGISPASPDEIMILSPTEVTVGELVRAVPARARVFEKLRIDYCCGGKKPLAEVCAQRGLDASTVLTMLEAIDAGEGAAVVNADALSLAELCEHIERSHHDYLRQELPRLDFMTRKVAGVHGAHEPRLMEIRELFDVFEPEMVHHMHDEENVVFPRLRAIETPEGAGVTPDELRGMFAQLEEEHDGAGAALEKFRTLTDDFTPPEWACNTFRALYDALRQLESDMHQHVHKENNVLFPRALAALGT